MVPMTLDLLRSRRLLLVAVCAGLLFTSVGYLAIYPSFEAQIGDLAADLPDAYKAFIGDADLATPEGYIRSQVFSLIGPLVLAGAAIAAGSSLARAERDRTLAVYAVQPLGRVALAGSWAGFVAGVAVVGGLAMFVGVLIGAPLAGADVAPDQVVVAVVPVVVFACLVGGVSLLASAVTGAPGTATGVGWLTVLAAFVLNSLAELIDQLSWLGWLSPWTWHGAGEAITGGVDIAGLLLLTGTMAVVGAASMLAFARRDLHL